MGDVWVLCGRIGFSFVMLAVIPLTGHPTVRSGLHLVEYFTSSPVQPLSPAASFGGMSPITSPMGDRFLGDPFAKILQDVVMTETFDVAVSTPLMHDFSYESPRAEPKLEKISPQPRVILTMICLLFQVGMALVVPGVAVVIGLLGGSISTAMMLFIPGYAMGFVLEPSKINKCKQIALYSFGLFGFLSVPLKIYKLCMGT